MLVKLDAADRLARVLAERGPVPIDEAARLLFAFSRGSEVVAARILDAVLREDARFARRGPDVVLASSPFAGRPFEQARFAVLDLETSGLSAQRAHVTEIGIVVLEQGQVDDEFSLVIQGERDRSIARRELHRHGARAILVGHNLAFDLAFIERELQPPGDRIAAQTVDTLPLARRLLRGRCERMSLAALAEFFGVETVPCHRALPDARATAEVLLALMGVARDFGARTVGDLCGLARLPAPSRRDRAPHPVRTRTAASTPGASRFRSIV